MINQLKFYEIDETTLGTDTEEEELVQVEEGSNMQQGVDDEDEELKR
jgi:hypothetical protein